MRIVIVILATMIIGCNEELRVGLLRRDATRRSSVLVGVQTVCFGSGDRVGCDDHAQEGRTRWLCVGDGVVTPVVECVGLECAIVKPEAKQ